MLRKTDDLPFIILRARIPALRSSSIEKEKGPVTLLHSLFFAFLLLFVPARVAAEGFDELKARYLSLRNTDVEVKKLEEWNGLSSELLEFAQSRPTDPNATLALLDAGILNQMLFEKFYASNRERGIEHVMRALRAYKKIETEYPEDPLADDALIRKGDIYLFMGDKTLARENYLRILDRYPEGDMVRRATRKLREITGAPLAENSEKSQGGGAKERNPAAPLVVLDPGHGGEDFGAKSPTGIFEKSLVLEVALLLEELLRKNGIEVRMTRRDDVFVPLAERTTFANQLNASIFVSLHANASPGGKASGFEAFYLDNTKDAASKALAERENSSMRFEGGEGDIQFILSDLIQNAKMDDSIVLANLLGRSVIKNLRSKWPEAKNLGVRKAPFYVLVGAHMPCVLVELFFIDHPVDAKLLAQKEFRASLAWGLFDGIKSYLKRRSGGKAF